MLLEIEEPLPPRISRNPYKYPTLLNPPFDYFKENLQPFHATNHKSFLHELSPDVLLQVTANRGSDPGFVYIVSHLEVLGRYLQIDLRKTEVAPGGAWTIIRKHEYTFSVLLSLLRWAYTSISNSYTMKHCYICCIQDLVDVYRAARGLNFEDLAASLQIEPIRSMIVRETSRSISLLPRQVNHGFDISTAEEANLVPIFFQTSRLAYRSEVFQNGLLIVDGSPVFVQDVTTLIFARSDSRIEGHRYRLLIPSSEKALAFYKLLSLGHECTLNALLDGGIMSYERICLLINAPENVTVSFKTRGYYVNKFMKLVEAYGVTMRFLKVRNDLGTGYYMVHFKGSLNRMAALISYLAETSISQTQAKLTLQNLECEHFESLFAASHSFDFSLRHNSAILSDNLYSIHTLLLHIQQRSERDLHVAAVRMIREGRP